MKLVHIGDGRYINTEEGARFSPPVNTYKNPRRVISKPLTDPSKNPHNGRRGFSINHDLVGHKEYIHFRHSIFAKYSDSGVKPGDVYGVRRKKVGYMWGWAKRKARKDMENIKRVMPDLNEVAAEALEASLTVLRGPQNQKEKLAAAKLLLEFSMSKPVAKSQVSVNAAEDWLASLGKDEDDS